MVDLIIIILWIISYLIFLSRKQMGMEIDLDIQYTLAVIVIILQSVRCMIKD